MSIYSDHHAHYGKASRHAALYDKRRETGKADGRGLALLGGAADRAGLYGRPRLERRNPLDWFDLVLLIEGRQAGFAPNPSTSNRPHLL